MKDMIVQQNMFELFDQLQAHSDLNKTVNRGYRSVQSPINSWPNYIYDLHLNLNILSDIKNEIRSGKHPNFIILNEEQLTEHKEELQNAEIMPIAEWPLLYADNLPIPANPSSSLIDIFEVKSQNELNEWCRVTSNSFHTVNPRIWNVKGGHNRFFLARQNNRAIATAMVFCNSASSGIYHCYTEPQFRNQGIGSDLFRHCWIEALKSADLPVVAQATQKSADAWTGLGMQICGHLYLLKFTI